MIAVDFETFYSKDHSVSDMGPWAYAHHKDTDIYLVAIMGEGIKFCGNPPDFDWSKLEGKHLVSHNAGFDQVVALAAVKRGIIKPFSYASWSCSADLAAYCGMPRALNKAVKAVFDHDLPKLMRNWMSGKRWEDAVKKGKDKELITYALNDSVWCLKLWEKLQHNWPAHERRLSAETRNLGIRGCWVHAGRLGRGVKNLESVRKDAKAKIPWEPPLSMPKLREHCAKEGLVAPKSLAKDSEEAQAWEDRYGPKYPWIAGVRDYRRSNTLLSRLTKIDLRVVGDGKSASESNTYEGFEERTNCVGTRIEDGHLCMPVNLKYWGAHTGRWSGDAGVNMQNLPRGEMFEVDFRGLFVSRKHHKLAIVDLSQIEPRVLAWLAKDVAFLHRLRKDGGSVYEAYARSRNLWTSPKSMKEADPKLYASIKAQVLGLGYGCGADKYRVVAKSLAGVELTKEQAKSDVWGWRNDNRKVTAFWRKLQTMMEMAVARRADSFKFDLPSGRAVRWWNPTPVVEQEDGKVVKTGEYKAANEKGGPRYFTWGGRLTENVVQALARDVFAYHLLQLTDLGFRVLWHVHDEVIIEVPAKTADDDLKDIIAVMSKAPPWMSDLPLAAEGALHEQYTK